MSNAAISSIQQTITMPHPSPSNGRLPPGFLLIRQAPTRRPLHPVLANCAASCKALQGDEGKVNEDGMIEA